MNRWNAYYLPQGDEPKEGTVFVHPGDGEPPAACVLEQWDEHRGAWVPVPIEYA